MKNFCSRLLTAILISAFPYVLNSQTHEILHNINGSSDGIPPYTPNVKWNGIQYFVSRGPGSGNNIWSTDATIGNTVPVFGENEYSNIRHLSSTADYLIFNAGATIETLYASDGTQDSTFVLKNFSGSTIEFMASLRDDAVVFITRKVSDGTTSLWRTDGTINGTIHLGDFDLSSFFIRPTYYKDKIVLNERNQGSNFRPVISDGTPAGTMLVEDYVNNVLTGQIAYVNSAVGTPGFLFLKLTEDGLNGYMFNETAFLTNILLPGNVYDALKIKQYNVVFADDGVVVYDSIKNEIVDLELIPELFSIPVSYGDMVYFHDDDGYVYETNGTLNGTKKISSRTTGNLNFVPSLHAHAGIVYYNRNTLSNMEWWAINTATGLDSLFAIIQFTTDQLYRPVMFSVGFNTVYDKYTYTEGREFWVYTRYPTSIRDENRINSLFTVYPNPASNAVYINFHDDTLSEIELAIYNSTGALIKIETIRDLSKGINVENFSSGGYYFIIKGENGKFYFGSFLKK